VRSDTELLDATRGGDPAAFDAFYRRHREVVLAYCAQRVRDPELAADLMAEAFASALLAVHDRIRELPDSPLAWLFAIAHRKLIDSYRRGRVEDEARRRMALEPLVLHDSDIERITEIARSTDVALELASQLPPDQFRALRARVLEEREYEDIACELRCSEAVVRKRVSRALKTLRTAIGGAR
jgi:RNA polymerase sigma-70 factor (ECF subfamily)